MQASAIKLVLSPNIYNEILCVFEKEIYLIVWN